MLSFSLGIPNFGSAYATALEEVLPFLGNFKVNRYTLDNGLKLLVVEDHSSPTFAYQTWFQVGSRNETPGLTGLAHLFEHMMFKETKNLKDGEFDRLLEGAGAEGENAFTSRDFTAYIQELPNNQLDLIAKSEAERMTNLVISQASYNTEREVVQNERRFRNENSPDGTMDQALFGLAFKKHPYHWPVIGYQKDLEQMSVQNALNFYHAHYSPNHATVIVVGDVKPKTVLEKIKKYYGELKPQATPSPIISAEPPQKSHREKVLPLSIQVEKLRIGFPIPRVGHKDIPSLDLIQTILADGKSSRLYHTLVDSGIATSVTCDDIENKDPTLFVIAVNLQKNKKAKEAMKIILRELKVLQDQPVSLEELIRAKNKMNFGFYEGLGSNYEKAQFLGQTQTVAGDFQEGIREHTLIQQVTGSEVQESFKRYFNPKSRNVIIGIKK